MSEEVVFVGLFGYPFCSGCLAFDVLLTTRARNKPPRAGTTVPAEPGAPPNHEGAQTAAPPRSDEGTETDAARRDGSRGARSRKPGGTTNSSPTGAASKRRHAHRRGEAAAARRPTRRQRKRTKTRRRPPTRAPGGQKETAPAKEARGNFAKGLVLRSADSPVRLSEVSQLSRETAHARRDPRARRRKGQAPNTTADRDGGQTAAGSPRDPRGKTPSSSTTPQPEGSPREPEKLRKTTLLRPPRVTGPRGGLSIPRAQPPGTRGGRAAQATTDSASKNGSNRASY